MQEKVQVQEKVQEKLFDGKKLNFKNLMLLSL
jgi:hypothetical protein